jgi:rSAM/selenodomain-associated transferase 2
LISVVIPTLNEADDLAATLAAARAGFPGAEIIVADGGSRDGTCAIAAAGGAQVIKARRGRGAQLGAGAAAARGATVVLLHADTLVPAGAERLVRQALADAAVVGGAFRLAFVAPAGQRLPLALRLYERLLAARSRRLGMLTGDQAIFVRADVLRAIGGVPDVPLFEDVRLLQALRRTGRMVLLEEAVQTSPRLFLEHGTVPIALLHAGYRLAHRLGVRPARLARWYAAIGRGSGGRARSVR